MLVVQILLAPGGDLSRARLLSQAVIANDASGNMAVGNYDVNLLKAPRFGGPKEPRLAAASWRRGRVEEFPRKLSEWELLRRALEASLRPGDRR